MVLYLKDRREIALNIACGDITDVEIEDEFLKINVYDSMLVELLQDGKSKIEEALRWMGLNLTVKINVCEDKSKSAERDIKKLREVFGDVKLVKREYINFGGKKDGI